ncbi:MAG: OmpH family outer membrane protein [Proteobacteria bacterium]|nr:OmpH family outer membrane protein [Pseudomonadota bacterium]MCH7956415.1 OmpH family outer membrane protein [Pseudomonadota bacterium]MCH8212442.1 OmpH family outer membrane protein [Pseudomonadota bacterium]
MKPSAISILCALVIVASPTGPAAAQQPEADKDVITLLNMAVIDTEVIRRNSRAFKDLRAQIAKYRKAIRADIQKEEEVLRGANEELARKRAILAPETFAEERRQFEERLVQVQRTVQKRKKDLERVAAEAVKKVEAVLNKIITDVANEQSLGLILRKNQTVLVANELDITPHVLKRLDTALPSLKVSDPGT